VTRSSTRGSADIKKKKKKKKKKGEEVANYFNAFAARVVYYVKLLW
jgi:hypothetical protein